MVYAATSKFGRKRCINRIHGTEYHGGVRASIRFLGVMNPRSAPLSKTTSKLAPVFPSIFIASKICSSELIVRKLRVMISHAFNPVLPSAIALVISTMLIRPGDQSSTRAPWIT